MTVTPGAKIPDFLFREYQMVATISFTAFWALLSLMITVPYSQNSWFSLNVEGNFLYTVMFYLVSLLIVCMSRRIMHAVHKKRGSLNLAQYSLWIAFEIATVCAFYTVFTIHGIRYGLIEYETVRDSTTIFNSTVSYGIMTIGIPTVLAGMYFALGEKENTMRVMDYSDVVSDSQTPASEGEKITLFDNNGTLRLSISSSNLYYIESDDNYVHVWYCDTEGELKQYMLRCKLKTIEASFQGTDIVRINRKYIVNMQRILLLHKEKDGFEVTLDREEIKPLPITKTYEAAFLARFNERRTY